MVLSIFFVIGSIYMPIDIFMSVRNKKTEFNSGLPAADYNKEPKYYYFSMAWRVIILLVCWFETSQLLFHVFS